MALLSKIHLGFRVFLMDFFYFFDSLDEDVQGIQEKYQDERASFEDKVFSRTEFLSGDMFYILVFQRQLRILIKNRKKFELF